MASSPDGSVVHGTMRHDQEDRNHVEEQNAHHDLAGQSGRAPDPVPASRPRRWWRSPRRRGRRSRWSRRSDDRGPNGEKPPWRSGCATVAPWRAGTKSQALQHEGDDRRHLDRGEPEFEFAVGSGRIRLVAIIAASSPSAISQIGDIGSQSCSDLGARQGLDGHHIDPVIPVEPAGSETGPVAQASRANSVKAPMSGCAAAISPSMRMTSSTTMPARR